MKQSNNQPSRFPRRDVIKGVAAAGLGMSAFGPATRSRSW